MAIISPTILAEEPHGYREQVERISSFAHRIQIDLSDGVFAPSKTVDLAHVWWPVGMKADLHLMYRQPMERTDTITALKPHLVIVHAEAEGAFVEFARELHASDIKVGVALLRETSPSIIKAAADHIDHVLIFSGKLGHFGGKVDMELLQKVTEIKAWGVPIEIGWDGGINADNARQLAQGGVDVLNVGGYIQKSQNPKESFEALENLVS